MKSHIVVEIDTLPDVALVDVTAVVQQAATAFKAAVSPLGTCALQKIARLPGESVGTVSAGRPRE